MPFKYSNTKKRIDFIPRTSSNSRIKPVILTFTSLGVNKCGIWSVEFGVEGSDILNDSSARLRSASTQH